VKKVFVNLVAPDTLAIDQSLSMTIGAAALGTLVENRKRPGGRPDVTSGASATSRAPLGSNTKALSLFEAQWVH
jgi:hypothetical protein